MPRLRLFDPVEDVIDRGSLGNSETLDSLAAAPDNLLPALAIAEGELIYDYAWFPGMQAADPASCVFASTCRALPLHLWDACSGELRCTYRAYDAVDEVTAATSLAFSWDGAEILGGFNRAIRIWDTARPGRDYQTVSTCTKQEGGLPGIVSCMDFNPDQSGLLAVGSYSGSAAFYDTRTWEMISLLNGSSAGLTQVRFGPDGNFLFTGERAHSKIWCWDVRYLSGVVYQLDRDCSTTNQRIQFDIEPYGRHLATGGQDGCVRVFDLSLGELVQQYAAAQDTVNGFTFHPFLPLAATTSGQRRYPCACSDSEDEPEAALTGDLQHLENCLLVWRIEHEWISVNHNSQAELAEHPANESGQAAYPDAVDESAKNRQTDIPAALASEVHSINGLKASESEIHAYKETEKSQKRANPANCAGLSELPKLKPFGVT